MFICVKLFSGIPEPLFYHVPQEWQILPSVGDIVRVPLRNTIVQGVVQSCQENTPSVSFAIKEAVSIEKFPIDPHYLLFVAELARHYCTDEITFIKRIRSFLQSKPVEQSLLQHASSNLTFQLTSEQKQVADAICSYLNKSEYAPTLLHGITGSGKSIIYKELIEHAFLQNKTSLFLLPEVGLSTQFEHILKKLLPPHISIFGFHSATSARDKKMVWHNLLNHVPQVIVGVHIPILLPIPNLGLIIVDEEHETGYQEKKHPKINTREAAILRASLHKIPIILGSATPSIQSLYNVKTRGWHFFQLKHRFAGALPKITVVSLSDKKQRKSFWISQELLNGIKDRLLKKEQCIIFLNRRGVSFFVQCAACSFIFSCKACSVSLTLHAEDQLSCHYCSYKISLPLECPHCHTKDFLKKGIGTQKLVTILQNLFPQARIARADLDVTINAPLWKQTLIQFESGEIDILIGTQTITKGYHFPNVTLVGIIWADINLHFPMFNAQETTLQQLIQVAGRAGRQQKTSEVIVQTMSDSDIFSHIHEIDYLTFCEQELERRKLLMYPPFIRFIEIELKHKKESLVDAEAHRLVYELMQHKTIIVLGPTQPLVHKIKHMFSRKLYIKTNSMINARAAFSAINRDQFKSAIFFTPNPLSC